MSVAAAPHLIELGIPHGLEDLGKGAFRALLKFGIVVARPGAAVKLSGPRRTPSVIKKLCTRHEQRPASAALVATFDALL